MGLFKNALSKRALDIPPGLLKYFNPNGTSVTQDTALTISAVYQAIRILSEAVAGLPVHLFRETKGVKDKDNRHTLYSLLHTTPNKEMTAFDFWRVTMVHILTWGNAFIYISRDGGANPTELYPLDPSCISIYRNEAGELRYKQYLSSGGFKIYRPIIDIMHIKGLTSNGLIGYAPIDLAAQSLGVSIAADRFGAKFFENNAQPGGILEHPGSLSDEAYDHLLKSWEDRHKSANNAGKVAILEEGMSFKTMSLPPDQAQFLETRRFQVNEVARWFNVPPHMLADLERATYANVEHLGIEFVTYSLQPYLINIEQACNNCLLLSSEKKRYFVKFNVNGLLRGDIKTRFEAYGQGITYGIYSPNEVRELEDLSRRSDPAGDEYFSQLNLVPSSQVMNPPESVETPPPDNDTQQRDIIGGEHRLSYLTTEQRNSANSRHKTQQAFMPTFEEAFNTVIKRQVNDINNAFKRYGLSGRFADWLEGFWSEQETYIKRKLRPVMVSYSSLVADLAAREVGYKGEQVLDNFLLAYIDSMALRHVNRDKAELNDSLESGNEADVEKRLEQWKENSPRSNALEESVRLGGAIALIIYERGGAKGKRWVTFGDNCPYCRSLAGKSTGIGELFLQAGANFEPTGASSPLRPGHDVGHAPAHRGCDCTIVATF